MFRHVGAFPGFHEGLETHARKLHIFVLRRLARRKPFRLRFLKQIPEGAALIPCSGDKGRHAVPDAESPFIGKPLALDAAAVKSARHHPERTQAALRRPFGKLRVDGQEPQEISRRECLHTFLVENRAFGGETVRPIRFQLVREIARSHIDHATSQ